VTATVRRPAILDDLCETYGDRLPVESLDREVRYGVNGGEDRVLDADPFPGHVGDPRSIVFWFPASSGSWTSGTSPQAPPGCAGSSSGTR
jgi:hypothetical protein